MCPLGSMLPDDVNLRGFDASFEIPSTKVIDMDLSQQQMLEVVCEGLGNADMPLEQLDGKPVACFVGAYSSDYGDMQNRGAEVRLANSAISIGRAIMTKRINYFLDFKG